MTTWREECQAYIDGLFEFHGETPGPAALKLIETTMKLAGKLDSICNTTTDKYLYP